MSKFKPIDWIRYGVHTEEYNECTESELNEIRVRRTSPKRVIDVLKELDEVISVVL